jgi:alpha-N-acetylglucosaminidase
MAHDTKPDLTALGEGANANKTATELFAMALPKGPVIDWYALEEPWTLQHNSYSAEPVGDCIDLAKRVMKVLGEN